MAADDGRPLSPSLYDADGYSWALAQADALRRRAAGELDWDNLAEEIDSLGKSFAAELRSRYVVLLTHLLKWRFQPERRSRSWEATIRNQRRALTDHLAENPGLKPSRAALFARAYEMARDEAAAETDLPRETFPEASPFPLEAAMDEAFWPEPPPAA